MKVVILAGGLGTRLSEETDRQPKPMVEIGGKPILWHILKTYSSYGLNDFIICCGYKGYLIKEYFANYFLYTCDVTFDMKENNMKVHSRKTEPWNVTLVDTGEFTMTGGRLKKIKTYIGNETFCFTYGDGLSNINISELINFHKNCGKKATLTAVKPPGRFGALSLNDRFDVTNFKEKPDGEGGWINGGFFVLEPNIFDYIKDDDTVWEHEPLNSLAKEGQLSAFTHDGFWQPMDTLRDRNYLDSLIIEKKAPWITW